MQKSTQSNTRLLQGVLIGLLVTFGLLALVLGLRGQVDESVVNAISQENTATVRPSATATLDAAAQSAIGEPATPTGLATNALSATFTQEAVTSSAETQPTNTPQPIQITQSTVTIQQTLTATATIPPTITAPGFTQTPNLPTNTPTIAPTDLPTATLATQTATYTEAWVLATFRTIAEQRGLRLGPEQGVSMQAGIITAWGENSFFGRTIRSEITMSLYAENGALHAVLFGAHSDDQEWPDDVKEDIRAGVESYIRNDLATNHGATIIDDVAIANGQMVVTYR